MKDVIERLEFVPTDYFEEPSPGSIVPGCAELELDLGCGDGGFLMSMAEQFPERGFLGVERLLGRVRKVCRKSNRRGLNNVRVLRIDSAYAVRWLLPKGGFTRIHLLFPDPWPKKRHQRRRIVTQEFGRAIQQLLAPGGEFLFKTDHAEYFEEASERLLTLTDIFEPLDWPDDAFFYAETNFERQWKEEGRSIGKLRLRKR
ncbi:MAG: tRNA (guanine-N7-)-methyltransferase [Verrucomicrobiales bacterium]|jgi:tRNA (guanine-N7-)-methyltransferase